MPNDYDNQLIESVSVRRNRLTTALLYGTNPYERRWLDSVRLLMFSIAVAALIAAICVGYSFVSNLLADQRTKQEQQQQQPMQTPTPKSTPKPTQKPTPKPSQQTTPRPSALSYSTPFTLDPLAGFAGTGSTSTGA